MAHSRALGRLGVPGPYLVPERIDDAELEGDADGYTHDVRKFHGEVLGIKLAVFLPLESGAGPDVDLLGDFTRLFGQLSVRI